MATSKETAVALLVSVWKYPGSVFPFLLIVGGDVVHKALAQLSGNRARSIPLVPVAFSFGWVAYAITTVSAVWGEGRLMPAPDYSAKVFNAETGNSRVNKSWILGRLLRDHEFTLPSRISLQVTFFEATDCNSEPEPDKDVLWWVGIVVIVIQLAAASFSWWYYEDWDIFAVTAFGTLLAQCTSWFLPQWRLEKWACRRKSAKKVIVTGGNGTRHVMVIFSKEGLDLEDLAAAECPRSVKREEANNLEQKIAAKRSTDREEANNSDSILDIDRIIHNELPVPHRLVWTRICCTVFALFWISLLHSVTGMAQNEDAWVLLFIGGAGMIQNVLAACVSRKPGTTGIHLKELPELRFGQSKVMDALMDAEMKFPGVGRCLRREFFNGERSLRPSEEEWWAGNRAAYNSQREKEDRGVKEQDRFFGNADAYKKDSEAAQIPPSASGDNDAGQSGTSATLAGTSPTDEPTSGAGEAT